MGSNARRALAAALLILCGLRPVAAAERRGFLAGFETGLGSTSGAGATHLDGFELELHAGGALGRRWAAFGFVDVLGDALGYGNVVVAGAAGRRWLTKRWWAELGVGVGSAGPEHASERDGLAVRLGTAVEVWRRDRFAMDLHARYGRLGSPRYEIVSLGAGFTWY